MKQSPQNNAKNRTSYINSLVAYVLAGILAITIHELSHLAMARFLGVKAAWYPNFISVADGVSKHYIELISGIGPIFSLVTGLLVIWLTMKRGKGFWALLVRWFGFLSAETGFGYFFIAPFVQNGDTGLVLHLLNLPSVVTIIVFAIGVLGFWLLLPKLFARSFSGFASDKKSFFQLGMWPWLVGTIVLVAVYVVVQSAIVSHHIFSLDVFGLVGVATIGVFTPIADFDITIAKSTRQTLALKKFPIVGIILVILVVIGLVLWPANGFVFS